MYVVRGNRSRERNLLFEINRVSIWILDLAYGLVSKRCFQCFQIHLQHSLTVERVLLADLQYWSYGWIEDLYWGRQYLFFSFQGDCLIGGELEIHVVLLHLIEEETAESLFHLATCSNCPIVIQKDCAGRAVTIEIESHVSINASIVLNHEVELLVGVLNCFEVKVEPCLTCSYGLASPIEVNCFCTSVVDNFFSLVHVS